MGADLIVSVLWTDQEELKVSIAVDRIRASLAEYGLDEVDELLVAHEFAFDSGVDELAVEVLRADPVALESFKERLLRGYEAKLEEFVAGLSSREVNKLAVPGGLWCYVTGGMSYGDSPTDAMDEWDAFLFRRKDSADAEFGELYNPFADAVFAAWFVTDEKWAEPVARFVGPVEVRVKG